MKRPTEEHLRGAIDKCDGLISVIARKYKVVPKTIRTWISYYDCEDALQDARDCFIDLAESKLKSNVAEGKEVSIIYTLKTLGRARGYGEEPAKEAEANIDIAKLNDKELALFSRLMNKAKKD